jgi:hypothetical protein
MPREALWYCDPSGAQERTELTLANLTVHPGINDLRAGIMAVTARLESGRLRVLAGACPNLLYEAALSRYPDAAEDGGAEAPVDRHNHALAALRYLISRLDEGRLARHPGLAAPTAPPDASDEPPWRPAAPWWHRWDRPGVWTPIG